MNRSRSQMCDSLLIPPLLIAPVGMIAQLLSNEGD